MSYLARKFLSFAVIIAVAQADASPLFDDSAVIEAELVGAIGSLIANKKDRSEQPFVLVANGVEHRVQVRVRGNSRLRVCEFPPLRIRFSASDTVGTVFAGQDKLKLVTHCRNRAIAETDALEEYAAYRIFNLVSDIGYRVRLLRIKYTDTDERRKDKPLEYYGFLIESQSALARRVGGQAVEVTGVSLRSLDDDQAALVYLFQYLIGNTDWSLATAADDETCCHNGDILDIGAKYFYVPYDFDLAGLVNAKYAYPDPALPIRKVTQRMYRGYCTEHATLQKALGIVTSRKPEILQVMNELPGLTAKDAANGVGYLNEFFARAEDIEKFLQTLERRCL